MFSLEYFVGLIGLGFMLRLILGEGIAIVGILIITTLWFFSFGFWAIAAFFELIIGFAIMQSFVDLVSSKN